MHIICFVQKKNQNNKQELIFIFHYAEEQHVEKLSIGERWAKLLKETEAKVAQRREEDEMAVEKLPPHQEMLLNELKDFETEVDWVTSHIVWAFNLPTAYNAPGQEHVEYEESKVKVLIDPKKIDNIAVYTQEQLEDVVNGWMYYLRKILKSLKEKVSILKIDFYNIFNSLYSPPPRM